MTISRYHKLLRVSVLVVVFVLIFDAGYISPLSKQLSDSTINYIATSVGVYAGVPETEVNKLSAELRARDEELHEREAQIEAREIAARDYTVAREQDISTYILSTILFVLTVLIILNYALDFARARRRYEKTAD